MTHKDLMKTMNRNHELQKQLYGELHEGCLRLLGAGTEKHTVHLTGDKKVDEILIGIEAIREQL